MAVAASSYLMARWDRRLVLYLAGMVVSLVLFFIALTGEALHWWGDFGLWLGGASFVATLLLGLAAASRFQVRELGGKLDDVTGGVHDVKADTGSMRSDLAAMKEQGQEMLHLLRQIRDRLPGSH